MTNQIVINSDRRWTIHLSAAKSLFRITMSSYEIDDEDVSPDELDERAEDVLNGNYVGFVKHAEKRGF